MGTLAEVSQRLTAAFPDLEWPADVQCELKVNFGFRIEIEVKGGQVRSLYTAGGFNHLPQLTTICKNQGWEICDCQDGECIDLDDPYGWYDKKYPAYAPHDPTAKSQ